MVVNTLRRLIPHGKGMVKRLDNQPRMEDVFTTNSRADQEGKVKHERCNIKYKCTYLYIHRFKDKSSSYFVYTFKCNYVSTLLISLHYTIS